MVWTPSGYSAGCGAALWHGGDAKLQANPAAPLMQVLLPGPGQPHVVLRADGETSPMAVPPEAIMAQLKAHGALLLRGFGASVESLSGFAAQSCSGTVFNESPDRQLLDAAWNIQSVNGGCDPFPLHPELSREPWKPDVCFFACIQPPSALGATTICDGVALVEALPPPLRAAFAARRLAYVQPAPPAILAHWLGSSTPDAARFAAPPLDCPYSFAMIGGLPVRIFTRPTLHRPMFCDGPAWGNFLLFSRYYNNRPGFPVFDNGEPVPDAWLEVVRAAGDRLSVAIEWQQGDLLMLDNSRFMHGRTAVLPDDGRLIASQFGYLKDAPRNPEEPADPPWRRGNFVPPNPRAPVPG